MTKHDIKLISELLNENNMKDFFLKNMVTTMINIEEENQSTVYQELNIYFYKNHYICSDLNDNKEEDFAVLQELIYLTNKDIKRRTEITEKQKIKKKIKEF